MPAKKKVIKDEEVKQEVESKEVQEPTVNVKVKVKKVGEGSTDKPSIKVDPIDRSNAEATITVDEKSANHIITTQDYAGVYAYDRTTGVTTFTPHG